MSEPIDQVYASSDRRARERRGPDRRKTPAGTALMIIDPAPAPAPEAGEPVAEAAFTAQVLGQTGQKRGLKGGPPVLEQARSAYLGAAYSGPQDRRPPPGRVTKTEI